MKVSYNTLSRYIPNIASPEEIAQDLIMHTAEVEEIYDTASHLQHVYIWSITDVSKHPNADKLNICQVEVNGETRQIICGAPNVQTWLKVPVALPGAELKPGFIIQKTKIRGETSNGMICSEDELWLVTQRQEGIMELPDDAPQNMPIAEYLGNDDTILEIDNKAINHRPDLFSHIGIAREVAAIGGKKLDYMMTRQDFSHVEDLEIINEIPDVVKRYIGLKISWVANIESPDYIQEVLASHGVESKWLLIDITNYSLYLYWQPAHAFDADKISGDIHIRYAQDGEEFTALNGKKYTLSPQDIVIADDAGVIALGGVIGGKDSAVSDTTKNIILESAWFDQAVVRKTGKRLGLRTDSLNVFEKDLVTEIRDTGISLITKELSKYFPDMQLIGFRDVYPHKESPKKIDFDVTYIQNLIGKKYTTQDILDILDRVFITEENGKLNIPLWRKDIENIADIAEEVARLDGYENIEMTIPRIHLGAVSQSPLYTIQRELRNFLTARGMYDMYTYSFVGKTLMENAWGTTTQLIPMKNSLNEEMTHLRDSIIPNLLQALRENNKEYSEMQLFEIEKVFHLTQDNTPQEHYELSIVTPSKKPIAYYDIQHTLWDIFHTLSIEKYHYKKPTSVPYYAHPTRTAEVIVWDKSVWYIGEIHPKIAKNFDMSERIGYISLNLDTLTPYVYIPPQAHEVSQFQENNFDITFVIDKDTPGENIVQEMKKSSAYITKVELFDIYEDETKLPEQRSVSFTVYYQSMTETLDDTYKNQLIQSIVKNVEKKWGQLR